MKYDIKEINDGFRENFISIVRDLRELSKEYHFKRKENNMSEKLALKKALFDELKSTNEDIKKVENQSDSYVNELELSYLQAHKDFILHLIDICVDRNKF